MTLRERLEHQRRRATATDRRLIDALLADPREAAFLSANALARRAAVHPASAVRFARKMGFEGYPPFRADLQRELFDASQAAERMRARMAHVGKGSVLAAFIESEVAALTRLPDQVSDATLAAGARHLVRAEQIYLFAVGHAAALAYLLETRLQRLGCRTQTLKPVARDMAAQLLQARPNDAYVLFALNDVHPLVKRIVEHARSAGARTVLVSDLPRLTLRPAPDLMLAAERGPEGAPRSLAVPMTLCNALVLHVSKQRATRALANLRRLDALRRKLEEGG